MRRMIAVMVVIALALGTVGCSDAFRKKFIRKKKEPTKKPRIYQVQKYEKKPTMELYEKHYVYWMTWQSELVQKAGDNRKRDLRSSAEVVSNLKDMQGILVPEKAEALELHVQRMMQIRDIIEREEVSPSNRDYIRRTADREGRAIRRSFSPRQMKGYLRTSFDDQGS